MSVKASNGRVHDMWWIKAIERRATGLVQPCRLIFEKCLIGRHLTCLRRTSDPSKLLQALPPNPAEFMVVPHADKRPTCARILQIGIMQIIAVDGAVVSHVGRDMEIIYFLSMWVANDVSQSAVVHALGTVLGVPDNLIDEVTEVKHKAQPICCRGTLVLEDHSPIRILG